MSSVKIENVHFGNSTLDAFHENNYIHMRSGIRMACKTGGKCAEMPTSPHPHLFSSSNLES